MDVKDSLVRFYIKSYLLPRALIFDKPGFVNFKISGKTSVFARQILMPEDLFVNFEKNLVDKFGKEGERTLYSIGKRFGYSFAQLGRFENIKDHPGNKVKKWVVIASKFVEGTYASKIDQKINVPKRTVDYSLKNFVICDKLGYDFFFATGGAAGVVAWIMQNPDIDGYLHHSKMEASENICQVKCAPISTLRDEFGDEVYSENNVNDLQQNPIDYEAFNKEMPIQHTKSFQAFLDANFFSYKRGIISHGDERFFLLEVTGMYLLELGIKEEMKDILFDSSFIVGKNLFKEADVRGIMEILSALGWGEVLVLPSSKKIKVIIKRFPWTKYYKDIDYLIIRGILSGFFSRIYKKKIIFNKPKTDIGSGELTLLIEN
jgi:hypothetical protein